MELHHGQPRASARVYAYWHSARTDSSRPRNIYPFWNLGKEVNADTSGNYELRPLDTRTRIVTDLVHKGTVTTDLKTGQTITVTLTE